MEFQIMIAVMSCYITGSIYCRYINFKRKVRKSVTEIISDAKTTFKKENNIGD